MFSSSKFFLSRLRGGEREVSAFWWGAHFLSRLRGGELNVCAMLFVTFFLSRLRGGELWILKQKAPNSKG